MDVKLKVILGKQKGHLLSFRSGEFVFGRGPECHIRPDSPMVSRQHCLLRVGDNKAWLRDLGSRNGTLVNGKLVSSERHLEHGDMVQVGPLVLEVLLAPPQDPAGTMPEMDALSNTIPG